MLFEQDVVADGTGHGFAAIEPSSLKELREEAGYIHDVVVDERARSHGVAARLIACAMDWLEQRKVPRVLLWTAPQNETAPAECKSASADHIGRDQRMHGDPTRDPLSAATGRGR